MTTSLSAKIAPIVAALCLIFVPALSSAASGPDLAGARGALNSGHANDAISALQKILSSNPRNTAAHNLLCRVEYQEQRWADAAHECETAVQQQPNNSEFHNWLGRAYGAQAERASKFSAFGLAKKVHAEFQTAAKLDPHNVDALSNLAEFAVEAPGFLGGGLDQAQAIATQMKSLNAEKYHSLLASIAMKKKDTATAERELKASVAQAKEPARAWMNLASFYAKTGNPQAMMQAMQSSIAADKKNSSVLVDGAFLVHKQNPALAEQLLRKYLASSHPSEDAPVFQVHEHLGQLLEHQGNKAAAQQEYAAAHALATDYVMDKH